MQILDFGVKMQIRTPIDNVEGNTLLRALRTLLVSSNELDVATGTFEIGAFLLLEETWQALDCIRILIGNETTGRTREQLIEALKAVTHESLESEKERGDFLTLERLASVRDAIRSGRIQIRVYSQVPFRAQLNLMRSRVQSSGPFAIHGSSNFTQAGLTRNVEFNSFTSNSVECDNFRNWYEARWAEASDVQTEILRVIEPHLRRYRPFTVYAKTLHSYFAGREKPADEWEENESVIYPMLSQYQKDGYHRALQIAEKWNGSLICDGVGSGKTYIGLMLLERSLRDDKRVLLIAPKSVAESVWEPLVPQYLSDRYGRRYRELYDIKRHTDLGREGGIDEQELRYFQEHKDVIIIDEAHHFRNPASNRGELLMALAKSKNLYLLTATPINNSIEDISNLINYFAQQNRRHFSQIGIHDFRRHFREIERQFDDSVEVQEEILRRDEEIRQDPVLKHVLIQRSRQYIKDAEQQTGRAVLFPKRKIQPTVDYSLREVYDNLYRELQIAFDRQDPFLTLAVYNTAKYHRNPAKQMEHRQIQIIGLIRTLLLKRLESSWKSFEASVERLLVKMAASLRIYAPERFEEWAGTNRLWWQVVQDHVSERLREDGEDKNQPVAGPENLQRQIEQNPDEEENDIVSVGTIKDFDPSEHNLDNFLDDVVTDMEFLTGLLSGIYRRFYADRFAQEPDAEKDDKLRQLLNLLKEHPDEKFIIFTEFSDTARYLYGQLRNFEFQHVVQIDSQRKVNREDVVKRFSPCYNGVDDTNPKPIRILISTDVLAEGLNLQDASRVINYDLHWNPVRLMQRIGRLDRRLNPAIEARLNRTNPTVYVWNFLPPDELEDLIKIRRRVDGKILRISRTLGIEGQFVSPDDDNQTLRLFNERYEGTESVEELMNLERQRIAETSPSLWKRLEDLPLRIFSGKRASEEPPPLVNRDGEPISLNRTGARGLFCCYQMPESGEIRWYFYNSDTDEVVADVDGIWPEVRCGENASRHTASKQQTLREVLRKIEHHIRKTYLLSIQAPLGTRAKLIAWLEVS